MDDDRSMVKEVEGMWNFGRREMSHCLRKRDFCMRGDGDGVDRTRRSGGVDGSGGSDVFRSSAGGLLRSVFIMVECGIFELEVL